jgi:rhomboid-like protein
VLFAIAVTYGSYLFAVTWTAPDQEKRLMPSEPLSRATYYGILGINVGVFLLWRFPPAWRILNRYFINVSAVVRPLSLLGNIFSHQTLGHLATNMILLYLIGMKVHEQMGRGDFLALYISSGVIASVASLIHTVGRGLLTSSSLGASGAGMGIVAAFCTANPE